MRDFVKYGFVYMGYFGGDMAWLGRIFVGEVDWFGRDMEIPGRCGSVRISDFLEI